MLPARRVLLMLSVAAIFMASTAVVSHAQVGYGGYLGYYNQGVLHGSGFFEKPYAMGRIPTPPYFALHPPVYYSHAVPRTYGYSPYPYPGQYNTPEIVKPQEILNPHAKQPTSESASVKKSKQVAAVAATPQWITNPYASTEQLASVLRDGHRE